MTRIMGYHMFSIFVLAIIFTISINDIYAAGNSIDNMLNQNESAQLLLAKNVTHCLDLIYGMHNPHTHNKSAESILPAGEFGGILGKLYVEQQPKQQQIINVTNNNNTEEDNISTVDSQQDGNNTDISIITPPTNHSQPFEEEKDNNTNTNSQDQQPTNGTPIQQEENYQPQVLITHPGPGQQHPPDLYVKMQTILDMLYHLYNHDNKHDDLFRLLQLYGLRLYAQAFTDGLIQPVFSPYDESLLTKLNNIIVYAIRNASHVVKGEEQLEDVLDKYPSVQCDWSDLANGKMGLEYDSNSNKNQNPLLKQNNCQDELALIKTIVDGFVNAQPAN